MKFKLLVTSLIIFAGHLGFAEGPGPNHYLVPDHNYEKEVLPLVNHAQISIDIIQNQFFAETGASLKVLEALVAKKEQNPKINIRVLLEFDRNVRNFETKDKLEAAGIQVISSFQGNVHAKAVCVDGRRLLLGSTSISKTSMTKSNEMNALVDSEPLGKAFTGYFDDLSRNRANPVSLSIMDENITLLTDDTYLTEVLAAIRTATDSLDVSMYLFRITKEKDIKIKEIAQALVDAQKRNVKIRVLLEQGGKHTQKITEANREVQTFLKGNGVNAVYLDTTTTISNSRFVIKDQKEILLGSTGWYANDLDVSHQLNLKIANPVLAKQLAIYHSQKIAYEGERAPVSAPRRFWIGFRRPDVTPEAFAKGINDQLIPGTKVGAERGLVGYTPTLLEGLSNRPDLPQEIALVTYQDDEEYRAIRETPEGTGYGNLHWEFFEKELPSGLKSGSAVAAPYQGQLAFGSAYYMTLGLQSFQNLEWSYSVLARKAGETDVDFLNRAKIYTEKFFAEFTPIGLVDYTFRIEKNYIFEYHVWKSKDYYNRAQMFIGLLRGQDFEHIHTELLAKGAFGETHIGVGQGVNVQFRTEIENPENVYSPLREKFLSPISKEPAPVYDPVNDQKDFADLLEKCRVGFRKLMRGVR